ncbi:MAG: 16S rRNA (cytosine(1402)-N(4))-methyltransferase RsmH [Acidobacteria bacterium]|nr:MAG: 16S rRNA (cytosine(1402)-N(4))-methyltransferase RsmH [Acidobacteriota bacterium]RPJ76115.1 MAG: 16S rRNA (cytosine(1402)-N(4))-methyltransferase RsmH [Acidobacteriota bacterium]
MPIHVPVMRAEVLEALEPGRGGIFVDGTVGLGGHSEALLEGGATRLVAIDRDADALAVARERLASWSEQIEFVHGDYRRLHEVLDAHGLGEVDGVLVDLGLSSFQLESEGRGFSFQRDDPLDMRMDRSAGPTAAEMIASASERELADVIFQYGEERYSRRIARAIVAAREDEPIATTGRLAEIVRRAVPRRGYSPIHPATRSFQALRIWVNGELENLDRFVEDACSRLAPGGRLAVIAFHSLEDRIVKQTVRRLTDDKARGLRRLTKKALQAGEAEVEANPRARSAKLRAVIREA